MNKLILIISIYIFNFNYISAQNFSHGTFIDISDTCHTIFFDGKNYVRRVNCYDIGLMQMTPIMKWEIVVIP